MTDESLEIFADYPGGNVANVRVEVEDADAATVRLEQDLRDTIDWWFYWSVGVESAAARTVAFEFTNGEVVGPWGPAVSHDRRSWSWLGAERAYGRDGFTYAFEAGERVYFAFSLPYLRDRFDRFLADYDGDDRFKATTLTTSEQGRAVPLLELGEPSASETIMFTCRSHACESTASYVLDGLLRELLDGDADLLERYAVHVVPFVDLDGVQRGDQGKHRLPHDHNRDYLPNGNELSGDVGPIYRSTAAILERVESMAADLVAGIDFHCPYKWEPSGRGPEELAHTNEEPFFNRPPGAVGERVASLAERLETVTRRDSGEATITYEAANDQRVAELSWTYPTTPSATNFFRTAGADLAATCEFPYFGTARNRVTAASSLQFGRHLARALDAEL